MEDLKQIQEFFSKPLNENAFVEAFKLEKALKGMGYDVKVKHVDDFGESVFEIYFNNPADADESIFYDAKKLGYDNVRVFANPNESVNEAYIVTYAKNKGEKPASVAYKLRGSALAFMRDLEKDGYITMLTQKPVDGVDEAIDEYNSGIYFNPDKSSPRPKIKDGAKSGVEKVKDVLKKIVKEKIEESSTSEERRIAKRAIRSIAKYRGVSEDEARNDLIRAAKELGNLEENMSLDDQAKAYYLAKVKRGEIDTLPEDPKAAFLAQMTKDQIDHDKETLRRERGLEEVDTNKNLKAIQIQLDQLGVKYEMDPKNKVQPFKAIYKPVNKDDDFYDKFDDIVFRYNLKGVVKTSLKETAAYIAETIKLGMMVNEELCEKGKRYIKARQAAGEKSSAYLSGRAVRVCKGQIEWPKKGKKKK